jgi:uncharacterized protein YfaS (alpha-2-macroglobulin family)
LIVYNPLNGTPLGFDSSPHQWRAFMSKIFRLTGIGFNAGRSLPFTLLITLNLLLVASLACSLAGWFGDEEVASTATLTQPPTTSPPTPTPQPLPPDLIESDPPPGVNLPLNNPVTLYFNQPMEQTSVERALSIEPATSGAFTWADEATLVFNPGEPLPPQSEISFHVSTEARSAGGMALSNEVQVTYQTSDYLRLTQSLPEPETMEVNPTSAIVAAFNQPVVPLGADPASTLPGFILDPSAQGRGEWLNTSTYIFYPEPPLSGGQTYSVQLNPNLISTNGSPLEKVESWDFTTASPSVTSIRAGVGDLTSDLAVIPLDSQFIVAFNQPMDPLSMESNFSLRGPGLEFVPGEINWDEDFSELTFIPNRLLARNSVYTLDVGTQAQALGGTTLAESTTVQYRTVPTLAVTATDPTEGGVKQPYDSLSLSLNGPVGTDDILQYLTVEPAVGNLTSWWNEEDWVFNLYGDFMPQAVYTLTVSADLPDPWGGTIGNGYIFNFTTAPLEPQLLLTTRSDVLFLTPQDNSISAQITNIYNLPTSVGSAGLSDFLAMVSGESAYNLRQTYQSSDQVDWVQSFDVDSNRSQRVNVYLTQDKRSLQSGLYYLKFRPPGERIYAGPYLLVVSDVHLTFKLSATDALVWAVDLRTNQPIPNAPVTLYDELGNVLASGQTDLEGIYRSPIPEIENPYNTHYAMLAQPGEENFGLVLSSWSQGVQAWDFGITSDYSGPRLEAYLYTDRPIYRPGQTVNFRGIVREAYNGRYQLPDLASLPLTLYKDYGEEVATFDLPRSIFGTVHGQYTLPDDAQPGFYRLANDDEQYRIAVSFQVAEYRKPEINLRVDFTEHEIVAGESLIANVNARYFFDAPAGNIPVIWTLLESPSTFRMPGYQVGLEDTRWLDTFYLPGPGMYPGDLVDQGEATTNADGLLTLELPTESSDQRKRYTLEVTVQDESGLPVSARSSAGVNPAEYYIGVRPDAWVGRAGEAIGFDVQVVDWDQKPAGERKLRAEFSKVIWVRESTTSDLYMGFTYTPNYTLIDSADGSTDERGRARLTFTPPEPGTYQLDLSGDGARTELILWVGGQGQAIWPLLANQRLQLTPDQKEYQPGDTAQVFIPNPYSTRTLALVTIERGVVLRYQQIEVEPGGTNLSLPLEDEDAPNVYLSVTLLDQDRSGRPDFRQGYVNLPVKPVEHTLNVQLINQPERAGPGEEVTFDILVTDATNSPVEGEFSLAVVDLAALALADPNVTDILSAFYGEQALGVQTGLASAAYAQRRIELPEGLGGGGGGEMVAPVVREDFPDTAYWQADIVTDEQGRAQVSLILPDSLTTWQALARGVTADTQVGEAEVQLVTTKDLIVRPVTPRFLVMGDHVQVAAIVQNNTQSELQVEVSLQPTGLDLDDPSSAVQLVTLPGGGRVRVHWWGSVQDVDSVDLVFVARSGDLYDAARPPLGELPVLRYTVPQTFATSGILDEGGERLELVSLPRSYDPDGGSFYLEMSSSLAGSTYSALEALEYYPYECTEQTISRFLPNLESYLALQEFGIESPTLKARLERTLESALEGLLSRQNVDGGWGWWEGGESDSYITAYVLFGLSRVEQAGVTVGASVLQGAIDYLYGTLYAPEMASETWQLDRLVFIHFSLAHAGAGDLIGAEALFDTRQQLSPWAAALLALTMENLSPGNEASKMLISDLGSTAIRSSTGAHWEEAEQTWHNMHSPLSTTAIVLYALAQYDPGSPLVADAVRYLVANRRADQGWGSTYSTAWTILALNEVMKGTGELGGSFGYEARLNAVPVASGQATGEGVPVVANLPLEELYPDFPNALIVSRESGLGRLYYTAALNVNRPVESAPPLDAGISLSRAYYPVGEDCPEEGCAPIIESSPGELMEVRLTLTLPEAAYYLLVEDYLPAGTEILDKSLKTSQQALPGGEDSTVVPLIDQREPYNGGWGWWYFSRPEIYDEHIAWAAEYLPAGTYELTYTVQVLHSGEFRVLPARAWYFYFPEVRGNSAGTIFSVLP